MDIQSHLSFVFSSCSALKMVWIISVISVTLWFNLTTRVTEITEIIQGFSTFGGVPKAHV